MKLHIKSTAIIFAFVFGLFISLSANVATAACSGGDNNCFPPPEGNCYASVSRADVGQTITWRTSVSGGNGFYSYSWSGTEGLSGNYPTVSKSYSSEGTKTASVRITSYRQTITRTCTVIIEGDEPEPPQPDPSLSVACVANPSSVEIGEQVSWTASASGGTGSYSYSWSGTNSLTGTSRIVYKSYTSEGTKTGTVRVTSGDQTRTATCDTFVDEDDQPDNDGLSGYCEAVSPSNPETGERVTWRAYPSGGDGDYDYEWSGSESLDGDERTIYKEYDNDGRKTATVEIRSDGRTITRTCSIDIDEEDEDDNDGDLEAYCRASPSSGEEGERIRWTVYPEGGDGDYDYEWVGDDNLNGDDKTIYHTYDRSGNYDAEVEVRSDGERVTARCDVDIDDEDRDDDEDDGIYLSSIPATGISPGMKMGLFATGVVLWSGFLGYLYVSRRNEKKREQEILNSLK